MPQQKERDATLADRPCPTIHVSMLAHLNVLWCPDFILWGLFLWAGRGVFSGGPMPQGSPGPHCGFGSWLRAARSFAVHSCPLLPAQVHGSPWHRRRVSMHRPCPCGPADAAVFLASLPRPREGVFSVGSHGGRSLWSWFLGFALAVAGASQNLANLRGCIKIGFIYSRSFSGLLKRALFPGCFSPKGKRGGKRGAKNGGRFREISPRCQFSSRLSRALWRATVGLAFSGYPCPG